MKNFTIALLASTVLFSNIAEAKHHKFTSENEIRHHKSIIADDIQPKYKLGMSTKPGRWCGWFLRTLFGGGPEYNVAWNWSKRGTPTHAQVGAIVVWPHHVGVIVGHDGKRWIVKSGNDGNRVRTRPRDVSKAVFRLPS